MISYLCILYFAYCRAHILGVGSVAPAAGRRHRFLRPAEQLAQPAVDPGAAVHHPRDTD